MGYCETGLEVDGKLEPAYVEGVHYRTGIPGIVEMRQARRTAKGRDKPLTDPKGYRVDLGHEV